MLKCQEIKQNSNKAFTYSNEGSEGGKVRLKALLVKKEKENARYNPGKWILSLNDNGLNTLIKN